MKDIKTKILQYPRGNNAGGVLDIDFCPTISTSGFQHNVWVIIYEKKDDLENDNRQQAKESIQGQSE